MAPDGYSSVSSGPLRLEYAALATSIESVSYGGLLDELRAPLRILLADRLLVEFDENFPLARFALAFGRWACPHAYWLFLENPGLRERMEHEPAGLDSADFAMLDERGAVLLGLRAANCELLLPGADGELSGIASGCSLKELQRLGCSLLEGLAMHCARRTGWSLAPLISRDWHSQLSAGLRRGSGGLIDVAALLAWQERPIRLTQGDWTLEYILHEPDTDISALEELPGQLLGSLRLDRRIARQLNLQRFPILEFAISALDWLSDPLHPPRRLHRPPQGPDSAVWGGYELGSPADGSLLVGIRRRGTELELLSASMRVRGVAITQQQLRELLLAFSTALIREIHARTGWSVLPLFAAESTAIRHSWPDSLPDFDLARVLDRRPGSRLARDGRLSRPAVHKAGPLAQPPGKSRSIVVRDPKSLRRAVWRLDFELLDFATEPASPADVQEQLLATFSLSNLERVVLRVEQGLPLLDFCINCLVWLCRHESVSSAASRERDPRRRGRPQDFILAYSRPRPLRFGIREDLRGYLLLLEEETEGAASLAGTDIALSHSELWMLMFDLGNALRSEIHRRWGWDIGVLFGPDAYRFGERRLISPPSLGYFKLEREITRLADLRDGVVRGPAGCLRI